MNIGSVVKRISDGTVGKVVSMGTNKEGGFNWVEVKWLLPEGRFFGLSTFSVPVSEVKRVCTECFSDLTRDGICKNCATLNF